MVDKAYISNIAYGWTLEQQISVLASSVPEWPVRLYRDELKRAALAAREPESLEQRRALLRPTARQSLDTIHVASLGVLAWRADDFARVVDTLAARKATVVEHHTGLTFDLDWEGDQRQIVQQFPISRREGSRQKGRLVGAQASAAKRNAISKAAADRIADRWGVKGQTATALCAEVGFTYHTMRRWLGKWEVVARKLERNAKRAAKIAALKEQQNV